MSLSTVAAMISFGALAAFSFVNLSVIKTYVVDGGSRSGADLPRLQRHPRLHARIVAAWPGRMVMPASCLSR